MRKLKQRWAVSAQAKAIIAILAVAHVFSFLVRQLYLTVPKADEIVSNVLGHTVAAVFQLMIPATFLKSFPTADAREKPNTEPPGSS